MSQNFASQCASDHINIKEYSVADTTRPFDHFERHYNNSDELCHECYPRIYVDCYIKCESKKSKCIQLKSFDTPSEHWTLIFGNKKLVSKESIESAHERILEYVENNPLIFYPMIACQNSTYGRFSDKFEDLLYELRNSIDGVRSDKAIQNAKRPYYDIVHWGLDKILCYHTARERHKNESLKDSLAVPGNKTIPIVMRILPKK
jgi:hypothetical protein